MVDPNRLPVANNLATGGFNQASRGDFLLGFGLNAGQTTDKSPGHQEHYGRQIVRTGGAKNGDNGCRGRVADDERGVKRKDKEGVCAQQAFLADQRRNTGGLGRGEKLGDGRNEKTQQQNNSQIMLEQQGAQHQDGSQQIGYDQNVLAVPVVDVDPGRSGEEY